jgi:hypothetical protein
MTSLNGSFQGLIPKEPKILARNDLIWEILKPKLAPRARLAMAVPIMSGTQDSA